MTSGRSGIIRGIAMGIAVFVVTSVTPVWAEDAAPKKQGMGQKLGRGVMNAVTGWIEIPKGIRDGSQEENPLVGVPVGLVKGLGLGILRTGVGALEAITFPAPWPKAGYAPVYEPEYVWS